MEKFITEGKEPMLDKNNSEEEDKYIFEGSTEESSSLLEFVVKLRSNRSMRIDLLAKAR